MRQSRIRRGIERVEGNCLLQVALGAGYVIGGQLQQMMSTLQIRVVGLDVRLLTGRRGASNARTSASRCAGCISVVENAYLAFFEAAEPVEIPLATTRYLDRRNVIDQVPIDERQGPRPCLGERRSRRGANDRRRTCQTERSRTRMPVASDGRARFAPCRPGSGPGRTR